MSEMPMHEACGKGHRTPEAYEKCEARAERRAAREQAKKDDVERRWKNQEKVPVNELVAKEMRNGTQWERIVTKLNRDYPAPAEDRKWTLWDVVQVDSINLLDTWGRPLDEITQMRLERHMLGDYVSAHPLEERSA